MGVKITKARKKSWQEKLADNKGFPKVCRIGREVGQIALGRRDS